MFFAFKSKSIILHSTLYSLTTEVTVVINFHCIYIYLNSFIFITYILFWISIFCLRIFLTWIFCTSISLPSDIFSVRIFWIEYFWPGYFYLDLLPVYLDFDDKILISPRDLSTINPIFWKVTCTFWFPGIISVSLHICISLACTWL